ncbi:MAG: hypothetical protein DRN08_06730 [Thermoplasmata archaeon]|nr:MAG: hypothetical protein DRN08_06730 [Thermoplasmata archaeon]
MSRKRDLEVCIKDSFGMDLYEFMKRKVESESLHDYEIANILNNADGKLCAVAPRVIGQLRNELGIRRANGFSRRFEIIYGTGAIDTFKEMIEDVDSSLSDVGKYFGFSREYARQVYKKIYGCPYTEAHERKRAARRRRKRFFR